MIKKTGSLQIKNNKYIAVFSYKDTTGKYKTKTYSTGISDNGTKTNQRMAEKKLKELRDRFEDEREQLEQPTNYLKDISAWLGHSNIATTMNIYAHIGLQRKQEMSKTLSGILG